MEIFDKFQQVANLSSKSLNQAFFKRSLLVLMPSQKVRLVEGRYLYSTESAYTMFCAYIWGVHKHRVPIRLFEWSIDGGCKRGMDAGTLCFASGKPAKKWALWGRSY